MSNFKCSWQVMEPHKLSSKMDRQVKEFCCSTLPSGLKLKLQSIISTSMWEPAWGNEENSLLLTLLDGQVMLQGSVPFSFLECIILSNSILSHRRLPGILRLCPTMQHFVLSRQIISLDNCVEHFRAMLSIYSKNFVTRTDSRSLHQRSLHCE